MLKLKTDNKLKYLSIILLVLILLTGAFFRLYKIREYMVFLGDEGRDALVVKRMLVDHKFTLLGPITSVGSVYMGPIYYYFMAPFLWLWRFDPVGPAIMVALFGVLTIFLLYKVGAEFFHPIVGLIASFLYAISPLPIAFGRSSWNPNIVPFFSLLLIYSLLSALVEKKYLWLIVCGLSLGVLLQLHYVTFMFLPIIFVTLILTRFHIPIRYYIGAILAFLLSYSPFLLFELRHQFVNTQVVLRFLWEQKNDTSVPLFISFWNTTADVSVRLFWRLVVISNAELTKIFMLILAACLFLYWKENKNNFHKIGAIKVIFTWTVAGILSYGFYRGIIYDYYFGSLFTAPYLLTGITIFYLWKNNNIGKLIAVIILLVLCIFNLQNTPFKNLPSNLLANTEEISRFVFQKSEGQPYNFALIAGKNSDHAYRYFLELWGKPPVVVETPVNDPERKTVTSWLLIVCEEKVCQPLGHPLWEIAGFGQAEIIDEWQVSTVKVFKLRHLERV